MSRTRVLVNQHRQGRDKYGLDALIDELRSSYEVTVNPHEDAGFATDELARRLSETDVLVTGWGSAPIDGAAYAHAEPLRLICLIGSSIKPAAPEAAWRRGIAITNTAQPIAQSVAEYTLGMVLLWAHHHHRYDAAMKAAVPWTEAREAHVRRDLAEMTIGVVGFGAAGRGVVAHLQSLAERVLVYDPFVGSSAVEQLGAEPVDDLDGMLRRCDVLTLHAGQTDQTRHMIGRDRLASLRDGALLVNTSRGALIDQRALMDELRSGRLDAALDVFEDEPLRPDHPMRPLPNVILSPHVAGTFNSSVYARCRAAVIDEVTRLQRGEPPRRVVTPEVFARMT